MHNLAIRLQVLWPRSFFFAAGWMVFPTARLKKRMQETRRLEAARLAR